MQTKTVCLLSIAVLAVSATAAAARDGVVPYDSLVCQDKAVMDGFGAVMKRTTATEFFAYINELTDSGRCQHVVRGEHVTFTPRGDGTACLAANASKPCMVSILAPNDLENAAIAAATAGTTGQATTTGQGSSETTGSIGGRTTITTKTIRTIERPGQRPVTTEQTTTETR